MDDYKERMKQEYDELCGRIDRLEKMLVRYEWGDLDFELSCPSCLLYRQLEAMTDYKETLEIRNAIEHAW